MDSQTVFFFHSPKVKQLTDYLTEQGIKVKYMHHEVDTFERMEIIKDLRLGSIDVVVGINLLREGLDLPEVSLVAILDADKEGFLRSETSLIQTIGRAARNAEGMVIMYADVVTDSMDRAITETERRRAIQMAYNEAHGIVPKTIVKAIADSIEISDKAENAKRNTRRMGKLEREAAIERLTREMKEAAKLLEFEHAAFLRDQTFSLAGHWPTHTPQPVQSRTEMAMWNSKPFWIRQGRCSMDAGAATASSALSRRGRMAAWGQAKAHLLHWMHFSASHT